MFPTYSHLDLPATAEEIASFWEEHLTFEASVSTREGRPPFVFYEGPPSANGLPGIHHVLARALKDIFVAIKPNRASKSSEKQAGTHTVCPLSLALKKSWALQKKT